MALLIPVENQVREMDPKLLLACIAAERGMRCIIGPRREMHLHLAELPRGIYLSKSLTQASVSVFDILKRLGHRVVAWDEEALVHPPPKIYFERRMSAAALTYVSDLFAWGDDNEALWREYPGMPPDISIWVTGNPRSDLLRASVRGYYAPQADALRALYGDFVLVNTNFNHVNGFVDALNLVQAAGRGGTSRLGRSGKGMDREYAHGLRDHKQSVFSDFQGMIPELDKAFPEHTIVVRPHPTENPNVYHEIARRCRRVQVTNEGNIVPWLIAAKALIHNGCTTGVEAYGVGCPAVTFRATVNDVYDNGFYRLPNQLSHPCFTVGELKDTLQAILTGKMGTADGENRRAFFEHYVTAQDGPLACERIVDVVEARLADPGSHPSAWSRIGGQLLLARRRVSKAVKSRLPSHAHNRPEFQIHRYPPLSLDEVARRVARMQQMRPGRRPVAVSQTQDKFFHIFPVN